MLLSRKNLARVVPFLSFLAVVAFFYFITWGSLDPDFGWHLQSGNYILHHWIPSHDIFTYTASDFPWINHEWFNDVIFALLYPIAGVELIKILFALLWSLIIFLALRKWDFLTAFLGAVAILSYTGVRAQTWSLLLFVLLERLLSSNTKYKTLLLPIIFMLWANLHGGFVLGFAILGIYKLAKWESVSIPAIILSVAATLVNPYGYTIYVEIVRTLFDPVLHSRISEWKSLTAPPLTYISLVLLAGFTLGSQKKFTWRVFTLPTLLLLASLSSTRYFAFFIVSILRYAEDVSVKLYVQLKQKNGIILASYAYFGIAAIYLAVSLYNRTQDKPLRYPVNAAAHLRQHPCSGNVFNSYNYGGYLIWQLPGKKVYIDGRMPSWKLNGVDYFANYEKVLDNSDFRKSEFKKYNITCAVVENSEKKFIKDLESSGWKTVVSDTQGVLLEK